MLGLVAVVNKRDAWLCTHVCGVLDAQPQLTFGGWRHQTASGIQNYGECTQCHIKLKRQRLPGTHFTLPPTPHLETPMNQTTQAARPP